ncbi:hypothetical protein DACRYDRAFT_23171 [Dacryopinax primogenitus]|uniref:Uncharacterized protein n=1 Tax=Dacryopinax primogenitus (strain DJM 731) TaxID=1858805 RepID=M5G2W3_DACPD|nr:uncharacterized protein DACRYDRAFT_23171 [Dacryopinax primogenitus]EJU00177.1 hypothetical protein DACRYDRAFT_23171 [Dacryopinax primogenitus]
MLFIPSIVAFAVLPFMVEAAPVQKRGLLAFEAFAKSSQYVLIEEAGHFLFSVPCVGCEGDIQKSFNILSKGDTTGDFPGPRRFLGTLSKLPTISPVILVIILFSSTICANAHSNRKVKPGCILARS